MVEFEFRCSGLSELEQVSKNLVSHLGAPGLVLFTGEMGAGKTTLIGQICRQIGVEDEVSSPTFSLVNEYLGKDGTPVYHFDMYRIDDISEAYDMGIEEYFESNSWCFVEWPEKIEAILPDNFIQIDITLEGQTRVIRLFSSPHGG